MDDLRSDPRIAGSLLRYHAWKTVEKQTVADHSWNTARILLAIWPTCPRHLLVHALVHDIGEIGTGDIPYPIKSENPIIKQEMDRLEQSTHLRMCAPWGLPAPASPVSHREGDLQDSRHARHAGVLDAGDHNGQ